MLPNTGSVEDCFPDTTGYRRITVGPSGRQFQDLQQALNISDPGTVIVLDAGAVFQGGFVLPAKPVSDRWIILISSRMDLLPGQGRRIEPYAITGHPNFPEQRHALAGIQTTNLSGTACISTQAGSQRYRLVGLEISAHPSVINQYGLINFGDATTAQNQISKVPQHLILDRCWVHGHAQATIMKYGVRMDCANGAIVDCHFSDFHSVGFDAQAISGINGPGPFKIINNYLEAAGENILIGGAAAAIPGLVPSDMEIRQNHFSKPLRWWTKDPSYAGKHWTVKNLFELKTGKRVLFEGNILEYCWADLPIGQSGYAILLTIRTENGGSPQAEVSDITIQNNIIRHTGAGISISGSDDGNGIRSKRILISNNLFDDINGPRFGDQNIYGPNDGTAFHLGEPEDVIVDHNSIFQTGAITWAYKNMKGFQFTNNIVHSYLSAGGYQGIYGPGVRQGDATFARYFPDLDDSSRRFHKNVLIGGDATKYNNFKTLSQNYFPSNTASVGFLDYGMGGMDYLHYRLATASPYAGQASDGGDIGADLYALKKALENKRDCADFPVGSSDHPSDFKWEILPNPANGQVTLNCSDEGLKYYILSDSNGQRVRTGSFAGRFHEITIHSLAPGIYSLQLNVKENRQSRTKTLVILY